MRERKGPPGELPRRGRAGERDGARAPAPASRRPSLLWLLGFFLLGVLAASSPYVYRRYFMTEEGRRELELEVEKFKEKLGEIKERAEEHIPTDLEELEELNRRLKQAAGAARDKVLEELRERGLTPAELKKKVEELRQKTKRRKNAVQDEM